MSNSSKSLDLSFLLLHGYSFGAKSLKNCRNSLSKVKFRYDSKSESIDLACKMFTIKGKLKEIDNALEIIKAIQHPHVVRIHSCVENKNMILLFMQWIDGENLLQHIRKNGIIHELQANLWFYQIVCAIKYLHQINVAHCKLTCESILITKMNVKISCLENIRCCKDNRSPMKKISIPNYYLPPEMNLKQATDPQKADMWSLGVVLFIMLNATIPFNNLNEQQLIDDQKNQRFYVRTSNIGKLSIDCHVVLKTLLEPDTNLRWSVNKVHAMKWFRKYVDRVGDS